MHDFYLAACTGLIPMHGLPWLSLPLLTEDNNQSISCDLLSHNARYVLKAASKVMTYAEQCGSLQSKRSKGSTP